MRTGELLKAIPKATPNNNKFHEKRTGAPLVKPKTQVIKSKVTLMLLLKKPNTEPKEHTEAVTVWYSLPLGGEVLSRRAHLYVTRCITCAFSGGRTYECPKFAILKHEREADRSQ
jgi:hypothetical protein